MLKLISLTNTHSGNSFMSLKTTFRIGHSTIGLIVKNTCEALCSSLGADCLKLPRTIEEWEVISAKFESRWDLPNCIGALDGKHVNIDIGNAGSTFSNYKGHNSIVLMALVDANRRFIYVDNGRVSDGGVWSNSSLSELLMDESNPLNIPPLKHLPGRNIKITYFIVADKAFPLKPYIMRPYPSRNLDKNKRICNYRLSRARMNVKNAFGILSSSFQFLKKSLHFKPAQVDLFVLTACYLHNLLVKEIDIKYINLETMDEISHLAPNASSNVAINIRNEIADYCSTNGSVGWQEQAI